MALVKDIDEETEISCRICYESHDPHTLIAPCLCDGDLKFVHRDCLNEYRAMNISRPAFSECTACEFHYITELHGDYGCCQSPRATFRWRVTFDVLKMLSVFVSVTAITSLVIAATVSGGLSGANYLRALYMALALEMMVLGVGGLLHGGAHICCGDQSDGERTDSVGHEPSVCCHGGICFVAGPSHCGHYGGGDCGGKNGGVVGVIVLVIAAVLITVGVVYALIVSAILISRICGKHFAKMQAQLMAREAVVRNLADYDRGEILEIAAVYERDPPIDLEADLRTKVHADGKNVYWSMGSGLTLDVEGEHSSDDVAAEGRALRTE